MTLTHISHFGVTEVHPTYNDNGIQRLSGAGTMVWFEGTVAALKRFAQAHGLNCKATTTQAIDLYTEPDEEMVGCIAWANGRQPILGLIRSFYERVMI